MQARYMNIKSSPQGLYGCINLVKGCNKLAKRDSDNLLPWLSLACHFYLHGCVCAYVCMCVHVHIVHSYRYLNEPETDRPLKKKNSDVVDNTSGCIHTLLLWLASTLLLFQPHRHHPSVFSQPQRTYSREKDGGFCPAIFNKSYFYDKIVQF